MMTVGLAACGPERDLSGVWRLEACGPEGAEAPACDGDAFVYELHLGRFGDDVTGLLVPYVFQGEGLDSFDKPNERGCHFLSSGSADGDALTFAVDEPGCCPADAGEATSLCRGTSAVIGCGSALFKLSGDDEGLEGTIECRPPAEAGADAPTHTFNVRFAPESGRPRKVCEPCGGG
jgi:hypothetical protein